MFILVIQFVSPTDKPLFAHTQHTQGFGDYVAMSYSRSKGIYTEANAEYHWVFKWDGEFSYFYHRGNLVTKKRDTSSGSTFLLNEKRRKLTILLHCYALLLFRYICCNVAKSNNFFWFQIDVLIAQVTMSKFISCVV